MALPYDPQNRGMRPAPIGVSTPIRRNFGDMEQALDANNTNTFEADLGRRNLGVAEQNLGRQNLNSVEQNLGPKNLSAAELNLGGQNLSAMEQNMGRQNLYHLNADPATDRILNQAPMSLMGNSPANVLAAETSVPNVNVRPAGYVPVGKDRAGATLYGPPQKDRAGGRIGGTTLGSKPSTESPAATDITPPAAPTVEQKTDTSVVTTPPPAPPVAPPSVVTAPQPTRDTIEIPNARGGVDSISSTDLAGMERVRRGLAARGGIGGMSPGGAPSGGSNDFWTNRGYESAADYQNQQKQAVRDAQINSLLEQSMMTPDPSSMTPGEVGATRARANAAREALKTMGGLDVERSRETSLGGYRKAALEASRRQHADALAELQSYHQGSLGMRQQEMESAAKHQRALEDVAVKNYLLNLAEQQNKATTRLNQQAAVRGVTQARNEGSFFSPSDETLAAQSAIEQFPELSAAYLQNELGLK